MRKLPLSLLVLASAMCCAFLNEDREEGEGAIVKIDVPSETVIGLPLPVQFTVRGKATLYPCKLMDVSNPFEIGIVSNTHRYVFEANPYTQILKWKKPQEGGHHEPMMRKVPIAPISIDEHISHEYLVDIAHLYIVSEDTVRHRDRQILDVPSNTYGIEFHNTQHNTAVIFDLNRQKIVLVAPNDAEKKLIENILQSRQRRQVPEIYIEKPILFWEEIVIHRYGALEGVDTAKFSEMGKKQIQYHLLLSNLVNADTSIDKLGIPPDELKTCLEAYKTEIMLLMYEIELAKRNDGEIKKLREAILTRRPNAEKQLDEMKSQGGPIAYYRKVKTKK